MKKLGLLIIGLIVAALAKADAYTPQESGEYSIQPGTMASTGGGQETLAFLGDFITWNQWNYNSDRDVEGSCGQQLSGQWRESVGYTASWSSTSSAGGSAGAGVGGSGKPSANIGAQASMSSTLGVTMSAGQVFVLNYSCRLIKGQQPTATIHLSTTEISGTYMDWHLFSGTRYEFHLHSRSVLGYDCSYVACEDPESHMTIHEEHPSTGEESNPDTGG
jgi:hypothetical protein